MIRINSKTINNTIQVNNVIGRNGIYDAFYLIGIGLGYDIFYILINASNEQEALDLYADSTFAHLTEIKSENISDYLQGDRKRCYNLINEWTMKLNSLNHRITSDSDYSYLEFKQDMNWLMEKIRNNLKVNSIKEMESIDWDSNGPYNDISYLGNYGKPHQLDNLRVLERIDKKSINWFARKED